MPLHVRHYPDSFAGCYFVEYNETVSGIAALADMLAQERKIKKPGVPRPEHPEVGAVHLRLGDVIDMGTQPLNRLLCVGGGSTMRVYGGASGTFGGKPSAFHSGADRGAYVQPLAFYGDAARTYGGWV